MLASCNHSPYLSPFNIYLISLGRNGEFDPIKHHSTYLVLVHENQRASLTLNRLFLPSASRPPPTYSSEALTSRDHRSKWTLLPNHQMLTDPDQVRLPGDDWYWFTEWTLDESFTSSSTGVVVGGKEAEENEVGKDGWSYGRTFQDDLWFSEPVVSGGGVRRRRWCRVMKRQVELPNPASTLPGITGMTSSASTGSLKRM